METASFGEQYWNSVLGYMKSSAAEAGVDQDTLGIFKEIYEEKSDERYDMVLPLTMNEAENVLESLGEEAEVEETVESVLDSIDPKEREEYLEALYRLDRLGETAETFVESQAFHTITGP